MEVYLLLFYNPDNVVNIRLESSVMEVKLTESLKHTRPSLLTTDKISQDLRPENHLRDFAT